MLLSINVKWHLNSTSLISDKDCININSPRWLQRNIVEGHPSAELISERLERRSSFLTLGNFGYKCTCIGVLTLCRLQSFLRVLGMVSVCRLCACSLALRSPLSVPRTHVDQSLVRYFSTLQNFPNDGLHFLAGIGFFFSAFMIGLTILQARYTAFSPKNSEEFNSASRSVKPGLIASGIVSAWTWAATLVCLLPQGICPFLTMC